jgi:redox-sensitive bicupin YhaK (pirin superfamily)
MPKAYRGTMRGTQLWVNLPAADKMMAPRYRGITAGEVPIVREGGTEVRIIAGAYGAKKGPVKDLVIDVDYFDVLMRAGSTFSYPAKKGYTTFCYVLEGIGDFIGSVVGKGQLLACKDVAVLKATASEGLRFMLGSGRPINEPVAWGGPIVMNTRQELERAFRELDEGTFIKG